MHPPTNILITHLGIGQSNVMNYNFNSSKLFCYIWSGCCSLPVCPALYEECYWRLIGLAYTGLYYAIYDLIGAEICSVTCVGVCVCVCLHLVPSLCLSVCLSICVRRGLPRARRQEEGEDPSPALSAPS